MDEIKRGCQEMQLLKWNKKCWGEYHVGLRFAYSFQQSEILRCLRGLKCARPCFYFLGDLSTLFPGSNHHLISLPLPLASVQFSLIYTTEQSQQSSALSPTTISTCCTHIIAPLPIPHEVTGISGGTLYRASLKLILFIFNSMLLTATSILSLSD